jgi:hypothetical protein
MTLDGLGAGHLSAEIVQIFYLAINFNENLGTE